MRPIRHVAIRAENIHIGAGAAALRFRLAGRITDVTYRGAVLDYAIRLGDDRTITATSTHRLDVAPGATVDIGIDPDHIVPLDD